MYSANYNSYSSAVPMLRPYVEPKNVCYGTATMGVSSEPFPHKLLCLQIVALPVEYSTQETVTELVTKIMVIGEPREIRIIEKRNYNQKLKDNILTRSAVIEFSSVYNTLANRDLYAILQDIAAGEINTRAYSVKIHVENVKLSWENGEAMTHLSIREARMPAAKVVTEVVETKQLALSEEDWNSLYIPIIPNNMLMLHPDGSITSFQPRHLHSFIENDLKLGKIARIDFIDRKIDNVGTVKAVFIHFENWNDNATVATLRAALKTQEHYRQQGYYDGNNFHKFIVRNDNGDKVPGYFAFKINHKPIPEVTTELNMAQLVAANKTLTEKMAERDEEIRRLTEELTLLREKVSNTAQ